MMKKLLIGGAAGVVVVGAVAGVAGSNVYAPGIHANGIEIGAESAGSAFKTVQKESSSNAVEIKGQNFTYQELGITYDKKTVDDLLQEHNMWKFNAWNKNVQIPFNIDEKKLKETISKKLPNVYKEAKNANVDFKDGTWVVIPAENGAEPVAETLTQNITESLNNGETKTVYELQEVAPKISTEKAQEFADHLNNSSKDAGFYQDDDNKMKISADTYASLINVSQTDDGFSVAPNEDKIRELADSVPGKVNKTADDGSAVVDENGKVLKTLDNFNDGYDFSDVDGLVSSMISQLNDNQSGRFALNGNVTKANVDQKFRKAVVNKAERKTYLYENDVLVATYPVAIGKAGTESDSGDFRVFAQLAVTKMGCTPRYDYCTPNVKWVSYYNGGEGFHGVYWHNDFGNPNASKRSHGCINMRESDAKEVYEFLQVGSPVSVR